jgi:hypothetical protein
VGALDKLRLRAVHAIAVHAGSQIVGNLGGNVPPNEIANCFKHDALRAEWTAPSMLFVVDLSQKGSSSFLKKRTKKLLLFSGAMGRT